MGTPQAEKTPSPTNSEAAASETPSGTGKPSAEGKSPETPKSAATGGIDCAENRQAPDCSPSAEAQSRTQGGLKIAKSVSSKSVKAGDSVTYTLSIVNPDGFVHRNAKVADDLSDVLAKAAYGHDAKASSGSVSFTEPKLTWQGDVAAGQTVTVTYSAKNKAGVGSTRDNAVLGSFGSPCSPEATDPKCATRNGPSALTIRKSIDKPLVRPGDKVAYTISIANTSTVDAKNTVVFEDLTGVLGAARYNDDAAARSGSVSYVEPQLMWTGDIPAGTTVIVTYSVTARAKLKGERTLTNILTSPGNTNCPKPGSKRDIGSTDSSCSATTLVDSSTEATEPTKVIDMTGPAKVFGETEPAKVVEETRPAKVVEEPEPAKVIDMTEPTEPATAFGETEATEPTEVFEPTEETEPTEVFGETESAESSTKPTLAETGVEFPVFAGMMAAVLLGGGALLLMYRNRIGRD
ncbi:hypothetical protein ACQB60_44070 [Actinomycetota bacterium Odt1-20B]